MSSWNDHSAEQDEECLALPDECRLSKAAERVDRSVDLLWAEEGLEWIRNIWNEPEYYTGYSRFHALQSQGIEMQAGWGLRAKSESQLSISIWIWRQCASAEGKNTNSSPLPSRNLLTTPSSSRTVRKSWLFYLREPVPGAGAEDSECPQGWC